MLLRIALIVAGLSGFAFSLSKEKPPGIYFFTCAILLIAVLGPALVGERRMRPLVVLGAMLGATAGQQLMVGFLAPEASRPCLTLQFLALQGLLVGAMMTPKGGAQ